MVKDGSYHVTVMQRMGPMVIQQRAGYKLGSKEVTLDVHVPCGARHGESMTLQGQGHEYPDHQPGDVVIQFRQAKHDVFKRQGADLGMNHTIYHPLNIQMIDYFMVLLILLLRMIHLIKNIHQN